MLKSRIPKQSWIRMMLAGVLLCSAAVAGAGVVEPGSVGSSGCTALTAVDSVRTNLWLCEALMEDVAGQASHALGSAPGAVRIEKRGTAEGLEFMGQVVFEVLSSAGFEVFTDVGDSSRQAAVDYIYGYQVKDIKLTYPRVGRTLGLWLRWVERDLRVSADIEVLEAATGRVLFSDLVTRQFSDRIGAGDLSSVNSPLYSFTNEETSESGWRRRLEEMVVVGTLAGMVAVYFANTGS